MCDKSDKHKAVHFLSVGVSKFRVGFKVKRDKSTEFSQ